MNLPQEGETTYTYYALQSRSMEGAWNFVIPPILSERMSTLRRTIGEHGFSTLDDAVKAVQFMKFHDPVQYTDANIRAVEVRVLLKITPVYGFVVYHGRLTEKREVYEVHEEVQRDDAEK